MIKKWRATLYTSLIGSVLGVVLLVTSSAYAQCPDGITSLWALDADLSDPVGGNNGLGDSISPVPVAGIVDGAQQFDGADTGITVAADESFDWDFNASFSIEYWFRRTADAFISIEVIVGRDDGVTPDSNMHWYTGLRTNGKAAFVLIDSGGTGTGSIETGEYLEGNDNLADGVWHHVAVVRDFVTQTNMLYVDGVLNDAVIILYEEDGGGFGSDLANLNIGWINIGDDGFRFNGALDEVAIYGRALTADEILQHFNDELSYCAVPDDDDDDDDDDDNGGGGGGSGCFIESLR